MKRAKTTTETASATIEDNGKVILDRTMVLLKTDELSPEHRVLHGSFDAYLNRPLLPGFYQLALEDGRSFRILVKGVRHRKEKAQAHFLVVPEE